MLVFHRTPELALLVLGVVEEAAQAAIGTMALGGPVELPVEMCAGALQRHMTLVSEGTVETR